MIVVGKLIAKVDHRRANNKPHSNVGFFVGLRAIIKTDEEIRVGDDRNIFGNTGFGPDFFGGTEI